MTAGALIDPRRQLFAFGNFMPGEDEPAVAIAAFHLPRIAHFQVDARVAEGAADAVAGDPARTHKDHFRLRSGNDRVGHWGRALGKEVWDAYLGGGLRGVNLSGAAAQS